jgi:hypothetical protein
LSIEYGECLGNCPVYSLEIQSNGFFVFTDLKHKTTQQGKLKKEKLIELHQILSLIDFKELKKQHSNKLVRDLHEKSVLNQFNRKFYINDEIYNEPNFVTDYAKTNIVEDIAETFAFYIGQNSVNRVTEESSGALRKINFISENERLKDLKTQMINKLSSGQDFMDIYPSIRKLNRNHKGESVSCIDIKQKKNITGI